MEKYAYFRNGRLYDTSPREHPDSIYEDRGVAYQADFFVSDGITFNLHSAKDVAAIPIVITPPSWDVVLDIAYIMKIRCGMVEDKELIPAFVNKTLDMMSAGGSGWRREATLQVIRNYYRLGLQEAGNVFEVQYRNEHPNLFSRPEDDEAEGNHLCTKYYFENQNRKFEEYKALKALFPALVPDTARGYYQIRTRKTKRFMQILELAESAGIQIRFEKNIHFCEKEQKEVHIFTQYSGPDSYGYRKLNTCRCLDCSERCSGVNSYGLACCYTRPGCSV